jgi:hypothetical protein
MFNPLHPFELKYLQAFIDKGVVAFVKQGFQRGKNNLYPGVNTYVLIHFEKPLAAQQYYDVLKEDPARELLFLNNANDFNRVKELILTGTCYMMLKVKGAEEKAKKILDKKIKVFIEKKLGWHPSGQEEILFNLDVQFGEVYAKLKFRSKEIKVKLAEIEET